MLGSLISGILFFTALFNGGNHNVVDISGNYQTNSNSQLDMEFIIENEGGNPNDILITLTRKSPLTEEEKNLLKNHSFDSQNTELRFAEPFILGLGFNSDWPKGENYSEDGGKTSLFFVCSAKPDIRMGSHSSLYEARYCMSGLLERDNPEMTGRLSLHIYYNTIQQKPDGSFVTESLGELKMPYTATVKSK